MNCQNLALRTTQSDGGGRLRSRQLREGVKTPALPLYNDIGPGFHSYFCLLPSTLLPGQPISGLGISGQASTDTRHSRSPMMQGGPSQEVLLHPPPPPSLPGSTYLFSASDALLGLTLLPIFNYYYYCHPCHTYILCAPNGPYINSLNFHDLLGLCYPGVINEENDLQKISETCARLHT